MNNKIDKMKKIRGFLLDQIADLTNEQLNTIPTVLTTISFGI
jgi:hypothetical protein